MIGKIPMTGTLRDEVVYDYYVMFFPILYPYRYEEGPPFRGWVMGYEGFYREWNDREWNDTLMIVEVLE